jgi:hypothetical protein
MEYQDIDVDVLACLHIFDKSRNLAARHNLAVQRRCLDDLMRIRCEMAETVLRADEIILHSVRSLITDRLAADGQRRLNDN